MKVRAPLFALGALFLLLTLLAARLTGGSFVYPVDDAYIHLALARSLADHGVYAVTGGAFSPSSSSIAYPYVLAALRIGLTSPLVPLLVNAVALVLACLAFTKDLTTQGRGPAWAQRLLPFLPLLALFLVPLVPVALTGMEHTLHVAATLALVTVASRSTETQSGRGPSGRRLATLFFLGALGSSLRYEAMFVAVSVAGTFALEKRFREAVSVLSGSALPILVFGFFLEARAGLFFPLSVLLKREHLDLSSAFGVLSYKWAHNPHFAGLFLLTFGGIAIARKHVCKRALFELLVALAVLVLHATFAKMGWLYRYEAYAIALALRALVLLVFELDLAVVRPSHGAIGLTLLALLPLSYRASVSLPSVVLASRNIFEQQVQTARFLSSLGKPVTAALNDIGAPSYFSQTKVIDLMGLGNLEVARARGFRIEQALSTKAVQELTHEAEVAIVYPEWFEGAIPPEWIPLSTWTISDNRVAAKETVAIYATSASQVAFLEPRLRSFEETSLPARVRVVRLPQGR